MQSTIEKPELLLPVGNKAMALAAIHNGADAIYAGFPGFNARGRTVNFEMDELQELIQTCHLYGVRVYLALNILIFENEFEKLFELLKQVLPLGPDALIVQDLGLAKVLTEKIPNLRLHASTQMTVTDQLAIQLLNDLNLQRFVLGRENSLSDIQIIKENTTKDLEVFVHGALCVAYSGQCLTSESIGGRSANRGQCAQSCRFAYDFIVDGEVKDLKGKQFLVSPQDLCGIQEVPKLAELKVNSLKVEGRLKSPDYVATVAHEYRNAIDQNSLQKTISENDLQKSKSKMATTYSRGFYPGWLHGVNHQKLVNGTYSAHRGSEIGKIQEVKGNQLLIQTEADFELKPGHGLLWVDSQKPGKHEDGAFVYECRRRQKNLWEVSFSNNLQLLPHLVGALVYLNHDHELKKDVERSVNDRQFNKRIDVDIELELSVGSPIKATISDGARIFTFATAENLEAAQKKPTTDQMIQDELSALGGTVFQLRDLKFKRTTNDAIFIHQRTLKEIRRALTTELEKIRTQPKALQINLPENISAPKSVTPKSTVKTQLNVLLRNKEQVEIFCQHFSQHRTQNDLINSVILDFEFGRDYEGSLNLLKQSGFRTGLATTRVLKPNEYQNLKHLSRLNPDVLLVRNLGAIEYFKSVAPFQGELRGDFSLNATNHLTVNYLRSKGLRTICASYDLNSKQLQDLLNATNANDLEITVHQYMPSFHMEHCVFAANLSQGSSFKDCGKPCEKHTVELKDQFGNRHFIKADQECRNTMYNAVAQSASKLIPVLKEKSVRFLRFEALNETTALIQKIESYLQVLDGQKNAEQIIAGLQSVEKYGLGEGNINSWR